MRSLKYVCLGVLSWVAFQGFSACTFAVDLDYLQDRKCPSGQKLCNDKCVTKTNPQTGCGGESCVPCTLSNATANCGVNGACGIAGCLRSYRDCNLMAHDGCEIDIDHDPDHCGSCTASPCVTPNGMPDCASGRCAIRSCNDGFGDCNQSANDGCETNLTTSAAHCSKCNMACPSGQSCVGARCQ